MCGVIGVIIIGFSVGWWPALGLAFIVLELSDDINNQ